LALDSFRGRKVLLVFSDPLCIPCVELAAKLEEIHRLGAPAVLMIGRGDPDANRRWAAEHKTTFPTVLQKHWEISREYRIFATPVGYLLDEEGILISDVLIGVDAIVSAASSKEAQTTAWRKVLTPQ
jgi:peroxiredoxin